MTTSKRGSPVITLLGLLVLGGVVLLLLQVDRGQSGRPRQFASAPRLPRLAWPAWRLGDPVEPRLLIELGRERRRVAGVVLDQDGRPAVGARVEARGEYFTLMERAVPASIADARGHFDLGPLPATTLLVVAHPAAGEGWAQQKLDLREETPSPAPDSVVLKVAPCAEVSYGKVYDLDRRPVGGAILEVRRIRWSDQGLFRSVDAETKAGKGGHFSICRPADSAVDVRADGFSATTLPATQPAGGHVVVLVSGFEISGIVIGTDGEPVAGALVAVGADLDGVQLWTPPQLVMSNAAGRFEVKGVPPGFYNVTASAAGYARSEEVKFQVTGQPDQAEVTLRLKGCRRLAGTVVDQAGDAIAGALVFDERTDVEGRFAIECFPFHAQDVRVDGTRIEELEVIDGEHDINSFQITLPEQVRLRIRVSQAGVPTPGAVVSLGYEGQSSETDTSGDAVFRVRPADNFQVSVKYGDAVGKARIKAPAQGELRVAIELERKSQVHGYVISRDGAPIGGVAVCLEGANHYRRQTTTSSTGRFEIDRVEPGRYTPRPACPAARGTLPPSGFPSFEVSAGQEVAIELRVAGKRESLSGHILGADGRPRVAQICLGSGRCVTSFRDGRFDVGGLLEGQYSVTLISIDGTFEVGRRLRTGTVEEIRIPEMGAIEVSADSPGNCDVSLAPPARSRNNWPFDDPLMLDRIEPGVYEVKISCDYGSITGEANVTVVSGHTSRVEVELADGL